MLFVFEGVDSVGKSTIVKEIKKRLIRQFEVTNYSFPGNENFTLGKLVYNIHHNSKIKLKSIEPTSLQLLHIASHIDVIERKIKKDINKHKIVILDRFWFSTFAYGLNQNISPKILDMMIKIENYYWGKIKPQIIFLIETESPININKSLEWEKIKNNYNIIFKKYKNNYNIVRITNGDLLETVNSIMKKINILLRQNIK